MEARLPSKPHFFKLYGYLFFGLGILFIPFPFYLLNIPYRLSHFFFQDLLHAMGNTSGAITSDSPAMLLLMAIFALLALLIALLLHRFQWSPTWLELLQSILFYYLALQLLKYGFDKFFKAQFYLPEPNTLYTPLGKVSKDLLFWSSMGSSYSYNVFMGLLEIIPGLLLLFRKTRTVGLLIASGVLANIVAINFSFGISVKLYSTFLLLLCLFLLHPQLKALYQFFIQQKNTRLPQKSSWLSHTPFWNTSLRSFIYALLFFEALFPHLQKGYLNDDHMPRPYLHGAYEVLEVPPALDVKRVFIHRNGYLIFQNQAEELEDFHLSINVEKKQFILTDYQQQKQYLSYEYLPADSLLFLHYSQNGQDLRIKAKALDWRSLPALQNSSW